jgi:HSP20 family molecular chaperone IbpA
LKNLLINNSQIILVVVNQLSLAEQIFLYQLKNQRNFDQLFIIHNLFNFETREDLEDYIENTIVRSIYFDISKHYYDIENESQNNINRPYYFVESQDNNGNKSLIVHFFLGNIETKDPWISKFNNETIKIIKQKMHVCPAKRHFRIETILEKELIDENKIDKQITLKVDDNCEINEEDKPKNCPPDYYKTIGTLKLDKPDSNKSETERGIVEKRGFITGYNPDYVFYKNNDTEFVVEVECAGEEDENISITAKQNRDKVYFAITGKKIYPKELHLEDKPFSLDFSINLEKDIDIETVKEINLEKPKYEDGIYKKIFKMKKIQTKTK